MRGTRPRTEQARRPEAERPLGVAIKALNNLNDREILSGRRETAEDLFREADRQPPEKLWRARVLRVVGAARARLGEVPLGLERGFDAAELVIRPDAVAALQALGPARLDAWAEEQLEARAQDRDYDAPARREGLVALLASGAPFGPRVLERLFGLGGLLTREDAHVYANTFRRGFEGPALVRLLGWMAEQAEVCAGVASALGARLALVALAAGAPSRVLTSDLDRLVRPDEATHYLVRRDMKSLLARLPVQRTEAILARASARFPARSELLLYLRPDLSDEAMARAAALVIAAAEDDALYALHQRLGGGSAVLLDAGPRFGWFLKAALEGRPLTERARERLESQLDEDAFRILVEVKERSL